MTEQVAGHRLVPPAAVALTYLEGSKGPQTGHWIHIYFDTDNMQLLLFLAVMQNKSIFMLQATYLFGDLIAPIRHLADIL
jgi:hypothetical protein